MPPADTREGMSVAAVEPWEIHSELVLVSPEVYERARELLPHRDPDGCLAVRRVAVATEAAGDPGLPTALLGYTVMRIAETAGSALIALVVVVALALVAQIVR
jgi:hypothetical protein